MSVFPPEVNEAADKLGGDWIKAEAFEGEGLVLQAVRVDKIRAKNPQYGAQEKDYLVKNEILAVGETFQYHFKTAEGEEKKIDSASSPMFIGFRQADVEPEDWVKIRREGERDKTRYFVTKVEAPKGTDLWDENDDKVKDSSPF